MELTKRILKNNYYSFLWYAIFLALAQNFMDIDTIIPAMLVDAGGSSNESFKYEKKISGIKSRINSFDSQKLR